MYQETYSWFWIELVEWLKIKFGMKKNPEEIGEWIQSLGPLAGVNYARMMKKMACLVGNIKFTL